MLDLLQDREVSVGGAAPWAGCWRALGTAGKSGRLLEGPVITASLISVPLNRTAVCTSQTYFSKCHRAIMLQTFNQVGRNCKPSIDNIYSDSNL